MPRSLLTGFRWWQTGEPQQMLIEDGRVVARSSGLDVPGDVDRVDLGDKWLLPSFVDAHCHILATGMDMLKLHLGAATSHSDVLDLVRQRLADRPGEPLFGIHYDQNRYGGVHLSRSDLDRLPSNVPIQLTHVNEHASVANSAALATVGVNESSPDPTGGSFVRDAGGHLTGLLLETAHDYMASRLGRAEPERMVEAIVRAGELMRGQGIGCASEMMAGYYDLATEIECYQRAADVGCPILVRLYATWENVFGTSAMPDAIERLRSLAVESGPRRMAVSGVKIFADGAISSATAAIYGRFAGERNPVSLDYGLSPDGERVEVDGMLIHAPERLNEMVLTADRAGFSIAIHSIGDYSTDVVIAALELTEDPSRHRIEHAMLLSDQQIERFARLGVHCSLQPEFLAGLGPSYRRQLGAARAASLIRCRSVLGAGISTSFSSDRPVVAGNPWDGIEAASNRPSGFDPGENCTREEAILAYTSGGAAGSREASSMGALEAGMLADYQVSDSDPLQRCHGLG